MFIINDQSYIWFLLKRCKEKKTVIFHCVRTDCVISTFQNNYILLHIKDPNDTSNLQLHCIFSILTFFKNLCLDFFRTFKYGMLYRLAIYFSQKSFCFVNFPV